jgi:hypothetical protein
VTALPMTNKFDLVYRSLLIADVQRELASSFPTLTFPDEEDLAYALSVATGLALSEGRRIVCGRIHCPNSCAHSASHIRPR